MAFQNFSFPQVAQDLGLTLADADLFSQVPPQGGRIKVRRNYSGPLDFVKGPAL